MLFVTFPRFNLAKVITQTGNTLLRTNSLKKYKNIIIESRQSSDTVPLLDLHLFEEHAFDLLPFPFGQRPC